MQMPVGLPLESDRTLGKVPDGIWEDGGSGFWVGLSKAEQSSLVAFSEALPRGEQCHGRCFQNTADRCHMTLNIEQRLWQT